MLVLTLASGAWRPAEVLAAGAATSFPVLGGDVLSPPGAVGLATLRELSAYGDYLAPPLVLPDGSFVEADRDGDRLLQVAPDGSSRSVAQGKIVSPTNVTAYRSGFLISTEIGELVWVRPDGRVVGFPRVEMAGRLATAPDGSVVILEGDAGERLRRLSPTGVVTNVGGTGRPGFSGDGGPARTARISGQSISVAADGSVLIGGGHRVRRITADGTIRTVAGGFGDVTGILASSDGGFLVSDGGARRVHRVAVDGTIDTLIGPDTFADFAAREVYELGPGELALIPDGLLITGPTGVLLVATGPAPRPAVRLRAARPSSTTTAVTFETTAAGTVTLEYRRRGARGLPVMTVPVASGAGQLDLPNPTSRGAYTVRITLHTASAAASDQTSLVVGRALPRRVARRAVDSRFAYSFEDYWEGIERCARVRRMRIDCLYGDYPGSADFDCTEVHAVTLEQDGQLSTRRYRCPRRHQRTFRAHPRYRTKPERLVIPAAG